MAEEPLRQILSARSSVPWLPPLTSPRVRALVTRLLALYVLTWSAPGWAARSLAELSDDERRDLARLFSRAQQAFEQQAFADAIAPLEQAYELFDEPNILYRIGEAWEQQQQFSAALKYFRRYLDAAPQAADAQQVRARIQRLEQIVAQPDLGIRELFVEERRALGESKLAVVLLDSTPSGARVFVGDADTPSGTTPIRLNLEPGTLHLRLLAPSYQPLERVVQVEAGDTFALVYPLQALPATSPTPHYGPWILAGAGLATAAAGAGLLVMAHAAESDLATWDAARERAYRENRPIPPRPEHYDQRQRDAFYMTGFGWSAVGLGSAGLAAGLAWWFFTPDDAPISLHAGFEQIQFIGRF